jgi:hypothetical protein
MTSKGLHPPKVAPPVPLPKLKMPKAHLKRLALGRTMRRSKVARGDLNLARAGQSLLAGGGSPSASVRSGAERCRGA